MSKTPFETLTTFLSSGDRVTFYFKNNIQGVDKKTTNKGLLTFLEDEHRPPSLERKPTTNVLSGKYGGWQGKNELILLELDAHQAEEFGCTFVLFPFSRILKSEKMKVPVQVVAA